MHATAKEPADRYKTAEEMATDLSTALSAERANELPWRPTAMLDETKVLTPIQPEDIPAENLRKNRQYQRKSRKRKGKKRLIALFLLLMLAIGGELAIS